MQIVSDIVGQELSTPAITIGASFADALMAALGIQWPGYETFDSLLKFIKPGKTYRPNMDNHAKYAKYQSIYDELYPAAMELMHKVDSI